MVILVVLFGIVIGLAGGSLVGAVFLRAACALYNGMAGGPGSPRSVPEPDLRKAMGIALMMCLVNGFVSLIFSPLAGLTNTDSSPVGLVGVGVAYLAVTSVSTLVMASILQGMLPTSFPKGLLVALVLMFLVVAIFGIVGGAVVLLLPQSA